MSTRKRSWAWSSALAALVLSVGCGVVELLPAPTWAAELRSWSPFVPPPLAEQPLTSASDSAP